MSREVFINYRRDDAEGYARAIIDALDDFFPPATLFRDITDIQPGEDFHDAIQAALEKCKICLVIINKSWQTILETRAKSGEQDLVITEIKESLDRGIYVIPILINRTNPPSFPEPISALSRRQFFRLDEESFENDIAKLVALIKSKLASDLPLQPMREEHVAIKKAFTFKSWLKIYIYFIAALFIGTFIANKSDNSTTNVIGLILVFTSLLAYLVIPLVLIYIRPVKLIDAIVLIFSIEIGSFFLIGLAGSGGRMPDGLAQMLVVILAHCTIVGLLAFFRDRNHKAKLV